MGVKADIINQVFESLTGVTKARDINKEDLKISTSSIYTPGPSYYALFNYEIKKIEYVHHSVKDVLGFNTCKMSTEDMMERIHDDDLLHFMKCQEIADYFYNKIIDPNDRQYYKRSFQYRVQDINGIYRLILHQSVMIFDERNIFSGKGLIWFSDISKYSTERGEGISFLDNRGLNSHLNITSIDQLKEANEELSSREIQILRLLSEGYKSKDIASVLDISYDTVRTHRNNILKKKSFKNISQALAHYVRQGAL